jgi:hypothetical protein
VNPRLGGYDAMMHLMAEARKCNCTVTLSDNYDDAYRSSPAWNPDIIARRPDGELWKSRNWTGEDSYVIGMAKYMSGPGLDRVRYTCERYQLRDATHIDVLSYFSIRNDWDRERPASGIKDLFDGRYKIFDEFARHGVNVSSEALRYPFIGKMSSYGYLQGRLGKRPPFGGDQVPLLPLIYRKSAVWGAEGRSASYADRILNMLFFNAHGDVWIKSESDLADVSDLYHLIMVPWFKVHNRDIESYHRVGGEVVIGLERNSRIWIDLENKLYSVTADGVEIARNESTFCRLDDERIAFYSISSGRLSAPLPKAWSPAQIQAFRLTTGKPEKLEVRVNRGRISVFVPGRTPVMAYRDVGTAERDASKGC